MSQFYNRIDFSGDSMMYSMLLKREEGLILNAIKDFTELLEIKQQRINGTSGFSSKDFNKNPKDLGERFAEAMTHIANQTVHNTLHVMVNSFLEFGLVEICRLLGLYTKEPYNGYVSKKGRPTVSILDRAKVYLDETLGINIVKSEWPIFVINAEVRHKIVHNSSNIYTDYSKKLEEQTKFKLFTENPNFHVTGSGFIFIKDMEYITRSSKAVAKYLFELLDEIKVETRKRGIK